MLHRLIVFAIVSFWLSMTGLLLVRELYPEATGLNAVPISYVGQMVFQHEQPSELQIHSERARIGSLHLRPRTDAISGTRVVEMDGTVSLALPGDRQRRFWWNGDFKLSPSLALEQVHFSLSMSELSQQVEITIDFVRRTASVAARVGKEVVNRTEIVLDEKGFDGLIEKAGLEPVLVQQFKASRGGLPEFFLGAKSSSTVLGGQKLSTFLLTWKAGDQVLFDAHLSQLGQMLRARVPSLGLELLPPGARR